MPRKPRRHRTETVWPPAPRHLQTEAGKTMSAKKPQPLIPRRTHERCPVCGEISYSSAGVHPQCAVRQADEKRLKQIKRDQKTGKTAKPAGTVKPWQKTCPKCKALAHVRKKVCECGHTFAVRITPPVNEGG